MENSAVKYDVADALTKGLNGVDKGMGFFFTRDNPLSIWKHNTCPIFQQLTS